MFDCNVGGALQKTPPTSSYIEHLSFFQELHPKALQPLEPLKIEFQLKSMRLLLSCEKDIYELYIFLSQVLKVKDRMLYLHFIFNLCDLRDPRNSSSFLRFDS